MSPLLLCAVFAAQTSPADAPSTWVEPDPSSLRRVFGVRYKKDYSTFELLKTNAEEWTPPLISEDRSRLYVGVHTGELEALDLTSGERLWRREDMGTIGWGMREHRGHLLIGSDSSLVAVDQQLGGDAWRVDLDGKVAAPMAVTGTVAVVPVRPNAVVAVDLVSAKVLWRVKRPTPDGITVRGQCPPTIDEARGQVYVGFSDGTLLALDLRSGNTVWVAALGIKRDFFADVDVQPVMSEDGKALLTASYNGGLYKLSAEDGKQLWKQPITRVTGLVRVARGLMVATLGSGQVIGLYEENGKVRWRYKVAKGYPTTPIALEHGFVAFGVSQGALTILEVGTGRPKQLLTPGSGFSVAPDYHSPDLVGLTNEGLLLVLRYGEGVGASRSGRLRGLSRPIR